MKKRTVKVGLGLELEVPRVPNFLRSAGHADGDTVLPLCAISEDELRAVGAAMTEALVERAREQSDHGSSRTGAAAS